MLCSKHAQHPAAALLDTLVPVPALLLNMLDANRVPLKLCLFLCAVLRQEVCRVGAQLLCWSNVLTTWQWTCQQLLQRRGQMPASPEEATCWRLPAQHHTAQYSTAQHCKRHLRAAQQQRCCLRTLLLLIACVVHLTLLHLSRCLVAGGNVLLLSYRSR